jgi:hypothetical protein
MRHSIQMVFSAFKRIRAMILSIPCKTERLQVTEDGMLRVLAPGNQLVWQVSCQAVTHFTAQPSSLGSLHLTVQTAQGTFQVDMVTKPHASELETLFLHLQTIATTGKAWYHDVRASIGVATSPDEKQMKEDVEAAAQLGWRLQASAGTVGHIFADQAVTPGLRARRWSLLPEAPRRKEYVTLTFVRVPDWKQHF